MIKIINLLPPLIFRDVDVRYFWYRQPQPCLTLHDREHTDMRIHMYAYRTSLTVYKVVTDKLYVA